MKSFFHSVVLLQRSGASHSWWETAKFAVRGCVHPVAHGLWGRFLTADAQRAAWVQAHPHLMWKLQRPYIERDVGTRTKLVWLCEHHLWLRQRWPAAVVNALCSPGQVALAQLQPEDGGLYQLDLRIDPQFAKEGELVLSLSRDGERLAVLAFTLHRKSGRWVAHIGCLQGTVGEAGAERVRLATKELEGLRPKQAVLQALYGLMDAQGVHDIHAVSNLSHVYQAKRRRRERVQADYDAFWTECGAHRLGTSFKLPRALSRKSVEEVPSRKRAQYRRRWALEDSLMQQALSVLGGAPGATPSMPSLAAVDALLLATKGWAETPPALRPTPAA